MGPHMWGELAMLAVYITAGTWALLAERRSSHLKAWKTAAASCGPNVVEVSESALWPLQLVLRVGVATIRIERAGIGADGVRAVVEVPVSPGVAELRLRPESDKPGGAREIEVGDEAFDEAFYVLGRPATLVSALLDAALRSLLLHVSARRHLEVVGGQVRARLPERELAITLPLLLQIVRRLAAPVDVADRLAENACRDPEEGVRLQNLLLLVRELPGDSKTAEALRAACSDPSPRVRLRAALALGAEGRGVLAELAESTEDDECSARAILGLGRELPFERAKAILLVALRRRRVRTVRACLDRLGRIGDAAAIAVLAKVMTREEGELAGAAAESLGTTGSPAAEPPLIAALEREAPELRVAAANALYRLGSAAAVLPLKEAAERFPGDARLQRATRQAIAAIQSRLQGASPGQLSLAGAEAGRLSLAADPAGRLSIATAERGQLSLGAEAPPE